MTYKASFDQQLTVSPRERCSQLIDDMQQRYGVVLTVRDNLGILRLPDGQALLRQRSYHMHPYCRLERDQRSEFNRQCNAHCSDMVGRRCRVDPSPFVSCCWKGMREVIVPIWRGGQHCITIFAAGMRDQRKNAPSRKTYSQHVVDAWQALPLYEDERARELTRALYTFGLGILQEIDNLYFQSEAESDRKNQIQKFIHYHANKPHCRIRDLANYLYLSPSRCSQVVRDLFNKPFQELLITERIERACHLLSTTQQTQEQIAGQCGFKNHYYFNRLFKKMHGLTPGQYRKAQAGDSFSLYTD